MRFPYDLTIDEEGFAYVCEYGNNRLQKFTADGQSLGTWGRPGRGEGELAAPWGVADFDDVHLLVADTENHRVVFVDKSEFDAS